MWIATDRMTRLGVIGNIDHGFLNGRFDPSAILELRGPQVCYHRLSTKYFIAVCHLFLPARRLDIDFQMRCMIFNVIHIADLPVRRLDFVSLLDRHIVSRINNRC